MWTNVECFLSPRYTSWYYIVSPNGLFWCVELVTPAVFWEIVRASKTKVFRWSRVFGFCSFEIDLRRIIITVWDIEQFHIILASIIPTRNVRWSPVQGEKRFFFRYFNYYVVVFYLIENAVYEILFELEYNTFLLHFPGNKSTAMYIISGKR